MSLISDVQKLYVAFFNRPADPVGLAYWSARAQAHGGDVSAIANAFAASAEYNAIYSGLSSTQTIDTVYMNLFGRHAEPGGLLY